MKALTKANDKVNFKTRLTQLDWSGVAFKNHSSNDCEKRFKCHLKSVRRYRTLSEIVTDVEANIKKCPIKKPLNSYQLFIQDKLASVTSEGDFVCINWNTLCFLANIKKFNRFVYFFLGQNDEKSCKPL